MKTDAGKNDHPSPTAPMRDSGIEWIGEIPEGWTVGHLRRFVSVLNGATPRSGEPLYWDGEIAWATPEDLSQIRKVELTLTSRTLSLSGYESCGTTLVSSGSVILSTRAPIGLVAVAGNPLCTNQGCKALTPNRDTDSYYLYYELLAFSQELQSLGKGTTFLELAAEQLKALCIISPPLAEQRAIADFLDHETSRIDTLIAKRQRIIGLLDEKRSALITQAVTKGLDPTAPMRDSGIEWIGAIPTGWLVSRIKVLAALAAGGTPKVDDESFWDEEGLPWIAIGDMSSRTWVDSAERGVTPLGVLSKSLPVGIPGTILFAMYASVGEVAVLGIRATWNQAILGITPATPNLHHTFLMYWLVASKRSLERLYRSNTQPNLNAEQVGNLPILSPAIAEQRAIADFLDHETTRIDQLKSLNLRQIELLKEKRQALITAAVTGKIPEARGVA